MRLGAWRAVVASAGRCCKVCSGNGRDHACGFCNCHRAADVAESGDPSGGAVVFENERFVVRQYRRGLRLEPRTVADQAFVEDTLGLGRDQGRGLVLRRVVHTEKRVTFDIGECPEPK